MAHFYGTLQGGRGKATRCGTRNSGISAVAAGWGGCLRVDVFERDGIDCYRVTLGPWQGSGGESRVLVEGRLSAHDDAVAAAP